MPKGYPETVTCAECGEGQPADFYYCPNCGTKLPRPKWERQFKNLTSSVTRGKAKGSMDKKTE